MPFINRPTRLRTRQFETHFDVGSPMDGTFGTGTPRLEARKRTRCADRCVDPRRHRSSKVLADEHIFIRPSTDAAPLIAMAYVVLTEGLHDQAYLDRYVQGFDEHTLPEGAPKGGSYRAYLLGEEDGIPKRRNGRRKSAAFRRRRYAAWPSNSVRRNRRRCIADMRRVGHCTASSSTAPRMRWRR